MNRKMLLIVVVLGVLLLPGVSAATLSACGIINSAGPYLVSQNLGTGSYCLNITASHVLIDCQGYNITYGGHSPGNGVDFQGSLNNVTIKNCRFFQNLSLEGDGTIGNSIGGLPSSSTVFNNTFYTQSDKADIFMGNVNNTNISWNSFTQRCGTFSQNDSIINTQDTLDMHLDSNTINSTCGGSTVITYTLDARTNQNISMHGNIINSSGPSTTVVSFSGLSSGSFIEGNRITAEGNGSTALVLKTSTDIQVRSNIVKATHRDSSVGLQLNLGPGGYSVNNSVFDNNTIATSGSLSPLGFGASNGALGIGTNIFNNVFVNNNLTAPEGVWEIQEYSGDTLVNYLIYNNSFGEIAWQNNGTGGFLQNLTLFVNGSLSLGETIFIGSNVAAVNTSAFTPKQIINSSANITLSSLTGDTLSSITKDPDFKTTAASVSGSDCLTGTVSCYQKSFSGGVLIFNTTSFSSFTSVTTSSTAGSVPEFEDYAMMFILVIGIGGFFVMKRKQEVEG